MNFVDQLDLKNMVDRFTALEQKQMPYAMVLATNNIAFKSMEEQKKETLGDLVWKKRMLPSAIKVTKATKSNPFAELFIDKKSWTFYALQQHYTGGDRHTKGLEKFMKAKGFMLKNENLIPVANIRTSISIKIIEEFQSKPKSFFIVTSSMDRKKAGIYTRVNGYDKAVLLFSIRANIKYKKRFDLETTVRKVHSTYGKNFIKEAIDYAISTAK